MSDSPPTSGASVDGVTIVIVTYCSADVIGDCLASMPAGIDGAGPVEIIVVDNDSTDDTVSIAEAAIADAGLANARVVRTGHNGGFSFGINRGIAASRPTTHVLVINPDIRLRPGSLARLLEGLDGGSGIAVPRLVDEHGQLQRSMRREPSIGQDVAQAVLGGRLQARFDLPDEIVQAPDAYRTGFEPDWASGGAMLLSRSCLDDVGPFDESFFLYSEETDFMLRARDVGHPVRLVAEAEFVHLGGELEGSPPLWSMRTINRVRLHRRRHGRASTAVFALVSLVAEAIRAIGRETSRAAAAALVRRAPGIVIRSPEPPVPAPPGWICFSAQDWWYHNQAHSDFQLLRRVGQRRPVLLVNSIGLRVPLPGRSTQPLRRIGRKLQSVARRTTRPDPSNPGFHVMTPLPFPSYGSPTARRIGAWLVRVQIERAARRIGVIQPGRPDPVIVLTIPTAIDVASDIPHSALVMNRSDKHSGFPEADGQVVRELEIRSLGAAQRIFYSAQALMLDEAEFTGDRARLLDHGVDVVHFTPRPEREIPTDLREIPGPRVGFFGGLDDYLVDFDLLEVLARSLPDVQLVLIGDATCSLDGLEALDNVHILGFKSYAEIPAYGSGFDVGLMPWKDNEWIRHSNPIKLKEYLALGLPIVSTDFPEVHRYEHLVRIARSPQEFVKAVEQTLQDGGLATPAERRAAVEHSTWDAAAGLLLREAESVMREPVSLEGT
ncbi:MAG: glycosyltransferase [Acidimicrobiales bacterium]